ncbi:MAG: hypothetical protein D6760_11540, partial [Deltaproteobacteria bacterium]
LPFEPFSAITYDAARDRHQPFVIEFRADWCLPCKEMEERTFRDPRVVEAGRGMSFLTVDMTKSNRQVDAILETFDVLGAPTTIFFGADGKEWRRTVGFVGPEDFRELLLASRDPSRRSSLSAPGGL